GGSHASVNTAELYRVPVSVATPSGTNVSVSVNGARLTFTAVASAGETTVIRSSSGPTPPVGVSIGAPPTFYQITTTASFTAPITVCISYVGVTFSDPSNLTLQHYESGSWINVTTNLDTANMIVCGSVSSLSPFAIFQKPPSADLVIGKSGPGTVSSGANLTYGIGLVNLAPNHATGGDVKDAIPAGTTF